MALKFYWGGQGGDEAFMGYRKFLLFRLQQSLKQKRYFSSAKNFMAILPMMLAELSSLSVYWRHRHRYAKGGGLSNVLHLPESARLYLNTNHDQASWRRQLQDISQFSLPTLLRYEDRNAMGNSVESRLPFLDHRLVELGLALPEALKLRAGYGKWPIREIMRDKIPNQIRLARYKRGFDLPLSGLLKAGLGDSIRASLKGNQGLIKEFLNPSIQLDQAFSDQELMKRPTAMGEAISLLWLNGVLG